MSETATKIKSELGTSLLKLGRKLVPSRASKDAKEQRKLQKQAYEAKLKLLEPWSGKAVGKLGWRGEEQKQFTELLALAARLAKDKDYVDAEEWCAAALDVARDADRDREQRALLSERIVQLRSKLITPLAAVNQDAATPFVDTLFALQGKLNRGMEPSTVAAGLDQLEQEAKAVKPAAAKAAAPDPVEAKRSKILIKLIQDFNARNHEIHRFALAAMPKDTPPNPVFDWIVDETNRGTQEARLALERTKLDGATEQERSNKLATLIEALEEAIAKTSVAVKAQLQADAAAIVAKVKAKVADTEVAAELQEKVRAFEASMTPLHNAVQTLRDAGSDQAEGWALRVELWKDEVIDGKRFDEADQDRTGLLKQIDTARRIAIQAGTASRLALEQRVEALQAALKAKGAQAPAQVAPAWKRLSQELDRMAVLASGNNKGAIEAAGTLVDEVAALTAPGYAPLADLDRFIAATTAVTDDPEVKEWFKVDAAEITVRLKDVFGKVDLLDLAASLAPLAALAREAAELRSRLDSLFIWQQRMPERLAALGAVAQEVRKEAAKAKNGPVKPDLLTFEADMAAIEGIYDTVGVDQAALETRLFKAEALAKAMLFKLHDAPRAGVWAFDGSMTAVADEAAKAEREALLAIERRSALRKDIEGFKTRLGAVGAVIKKSAAGDKETFKDLEQLIKQVNKKYDNKLDDEARKQLDQILSRLQALEDTPAGVSFGSVQQLQNVATGWRTALASVRSELERIRTKAAEAAAAAAVDPAGIAGPITVLQDRLASVDMTDSVLKLSSADETIADRKGAREAALRDVRALRSILDAGDPVVAQLERNPFGVRKPFAKMRTFVDEIEFNALRAVPPS